MYGQIFPAPAAFFDGSNDYLYNNNTSVSDTDELTLSFWIRPSSLTSVHTILNGYFSRLWVYISSVGQLIVILQSSVSTLLSYSTATGAISAGSWHHVVLSVDTGTTGVNDNACYINDVQQANVSVLTAGSIDFTTNKQLCVGAFYNTFVVPSDSFHYHGDIAELYIDNSFVDLSSASARQKFAHKCNPVFLGTQGQCPTGSVPWVYLSDGFDDFHLNRGALIQQPFSQLFTEFGALTVGDKPVRYS